MEDNRESSKRSPIESAETVNRARTARQLAYHFLRTRILQRQFDAGVRLRPEQIASDIGVSRMPVREALRLLEAEGLVTTLPNRGVVVSTLTADEVVELIEIRASLEGLAARLGTAHADEDALSDIEHLVGRMRRSEDDPLLWIERHDAVHARLNDLCRRQHLCRLAAQVRSQVQPYLLLYTASTPAAAREGHRHDVILEAMRAGDAAAADQAMREHILANAVHIARHVRPR